MLSRLLGCAVSLSAAMFTASPSLGAWSLDPANPLVVAAPSPGEFPRSEFSWPVGVPDGGGGSIVAWLKDNPETDLGTAYAQRLSPQGEPMWPVPGVALGPEELGRGLLFALSDGRGGIIVVWYKRHTPQGSSIPANGDLRLQHVDSNGNLLWGPNGITIAAPAESQGLDVTGLVEDGNGGVIVLTRVYNPDTARLEIVARRFDSAGTPVYATQIPFTSQETQCSTVCGGLVIAPDRQGGAVIAWSKYKNSTESDIWARSISSSGALGWGPDGIAVCTAENEQSDVQISSSEDGNWFHIGWADKRRRLHGDIRPFVQCLDRAGVAQWAPDGVAATSNPGDEALLAAIVSDGKQAWAAWVENQFARVQKLDSTGQRLLSGGAGHLVGTNPGGRPWPFKVVGDFYGGIYCSWPLRTESDYVPDHEDGEGNTNTYYDSYAQRVLPDGRNAWGEHGKAVQAQRRTTKLVRSIVPTHAGKAVFFLTSRHGPLEQENSRGTSIRAALLPLIATFPADHQQGLRIRSNGGWWQVLTYNYLLQQSVTTVPTSEDSAVPYRAISPYPMGLFLYDYVAGRYTSGVYVQRDELIP